MKMSGPMVNNESSRQTHRQQQRIESRQSPSPPMGCLEALKHISCSLSCGGTTCSIHETSDVTDSPSPEMKPKAPSAVARPTASRKRKVSQKTASSLSEADEEGPKRVVVQRRPRKRTKLAPQLSTSAPPPSEALSCVDGTLNEHPRAIDL